MNSWAKLLSCLFIWRAANSLIEGPSALLQVQVNEWDKSLCLKFTCRSSFVGTYNCLKALVLSRIKSLYNAQSRHLSTHIVSHWQSDNYSVKSLCRCEESASSWLWEPIKRSCLSLTSYKSLFIMRASLELYIKSYIWNSISSDWVNCDII